MCTGQTATRFSTTTAGADAFEAICSNRTLRLGDLFAMNDFMERHWGYRVWEEAAAGLLEDLGEAFIDEIDQVFHYSGYQGLLLGSCLSKQGDVLSQWRAYADDGAGYAIGFSARELSDQMPVSMLEVLYDHEAQVREMTTLVRALHVVKTTPALESGFGELCLVASTDKSAYKNPAFSEEAEVRLVHLIDLVPTEHGVKFEDGGGHLAGVDVPGQPVQFRFIKGNPSPFLDLDLFGGGDRNPIKRVVLGPKSRSSPLEISLYLETIGLEGVSVDRSEASYQ